MIALPASVAEIGNGHRMTNRSDATAVYVEVRSRSTADVITCADIDMMSPSSGSRFLHKDGKPYSGTRRRIMCRSKVTRATRHRFGHALWLIAPRSV
ncbi:hypothetical protein PPMP20_34255 [Paraburkholderia phymatum]|uniref:hypothetical protein n=1 Tax=Paraburkholderia phymatum TaxID=148447 RepID=UPI0000E7C27E|nr:hypothetical protein [Paraburkholderia phymatum]